MDTLFDILPKFLKILIRSGSHTEPYGRQPEISFQEELNLHVNLLHNSVHYSCNIGNFFPGAMLKIGVDLSGGLL